MTVEEVQHSIDELKSQGWSEQDILGAFYAMFQDDKIDVNELGALCEVLGYELTEEFKNMSTEDQKTKGYSEIEDDEASEEEVEEAKEIPDGGDEEDEDKEKPEGDKKPEKEEEEDEEAKVRKLYGFDK